MGNAHGSDKKKSSKRSESTSRSSRSQSRSTPTSPDGKVARLRRDSLTTWTPSNNNTTSDFPLSMQPNFECNFSNDTYGQDLKLHWNTYRESPVGSSRDNAYDMFLHQLSLSLTGQDTNGIAIPMPSLPSEIIYGMVSNLRELVGVQGATSAHGSGVVKYYNVTREQLDARFRNYNSNATSKKDKENSVNAISKLCITIECLEKMSKSPYYRTIMQLARTAPVIAGVTKAVLSLHNANAQSLLDLAKRRRKSSGEQKSTMRNKQDKEQEEDKDKDNKQANSHAHAYSNGSNHTHEKQSTSNHSIDMSTSTTNMLRRLVVALSCLFSRLTEQCGIWRYGNVMSPIMMNEPQDDEKVRDARRNTTASNAPYFCDELLDAIKLLLSITRGHLDDQEQNDFQNQDRKGSKRREQFKRSYW